jgi:CubicO group peptidase (beta-lactamase class C family)
MTTLDFAKRYLFGPLGILAGRWDRDPQGICFGGSGLTMTPRDMARFGDMVRREGRTEHDTVVRESWIRASQQPNNAANSVWSDFTERNYGFSWWTNRSGSDSIFFAAGSGGQFIIIVPSKNAVIVTTANPNQSAAVVEAQEERIIRIISRYILPALR